MGRKQRRSALVAAFGIFLAISIGLGIGVGVPMVRLARDPEGFREWVDGFGVWGRVLYAGVVALQVVVALIPGEPLEIAGGYAFGAWEGTALALAGIVAGSAAVFALVRRFGRGVAEIFFPARKLEDVSFLRDPDRTRAMAFLLMLIPGTPKDLLSYAAGLTKLGLWEWLGIVTIARIPSVVGSAISGGAAGSADYVIAAAALAVTAVLSGAGLLWYRSICKARNGTK